MKPPPKDWPRISSAVFYEDAAAAIEWLCKAFGFEKRLVVEGEGGSIEHSEIELPDNGLIMVGSCGTIKQRPDGLPCKSPKQLDGAVTQALCVFVDNADEHCQKAKDAGAIIAMEPKTSDYGDDYWADRSYRAIDPEGHHWWFMQRVHTGGVPTP